MIEEEKPLCDKCGAALVGGNFIRYETPMIGNPYPEDLIVCPREECNVWASIEAGLAWAEYEQDRTQWIYETGDLELL